MDIGCRGAVRGSMLLGDGEGVRFGCRGRKESGLFCSSSFVRIGSTVTMAGGGRKSSVRDRLIMGRTSILGLNEKLLALVAWTVLLDFTWRVGLTIEANQVVGAFGSVVVVVVVVSF